MLTARSYANGKKTKIRTFLSQEIVINRQIGFAEKLFTPIGMLLGVSLGIFCLALHAVIPFWEAFSYFAYFLFILGYACAVGGGYLIAWQARLMEPVYSKKKSQFL